MTNSDPLHSTHNAKSESSRRAERALNALHESGQVRPVVTYSFLGLCLVITIPTLFYPQLYNVFGGMEPRQHGWQLVTAAFEHGWPGFHGSVHLALNTFLVLECGRPCERLLGSRRFLILVILSLAANAVAIALTEGTNGSSLVIWSWGPSLFAALMWARHEGAAVGTAGYARIRGILLLMYGVVMIAMAFLPYLFGWRGNPLVSYFLANLYHLVATGVGIVFALYSARYIRDRMRGLDDPT